MWGLEKGNGSLGATLRFIAQFWLQLDNPFPGWSQGCEKATHDTATTARAAATTMNPPVPLSHETVTESKSFP